MSETFIKIARGTNPKFLITVLNDDTTPVDLTDVLGYGLSIFQKGGKELVRFSKNTIAGWELATPEDEAQGIFSVIIPHKYTREGELAKYYAEVLLQTNDGINTFISKNPGGKAFIELIDSPTKTVTTL